MSKKEDELELLEFETRTKYNPVTKLPVAKFRYLNGLLQATPDDKPSYILYDEKGRPKLMEWHDKDELHREDAAAAIDIDPDTGVHTCESFYWQGRPREKHLGPFHIVRDRLTGEVRQTLFPDDNELPYDFDRPEPS